MLAQAMAAKQPQGGAMPKENASQQQGANGQGANAREMYQICAGQMLKWLYSDEGFEAATTMLQSGDPREGMARLIAQLLDMANDSAVMIGKKIPPEILFKSGMEVARALSEIAQKVGVLDEATEKDATEAAFYEAIALFAQSASQEALTEQDRQRFLELIDLLEQMEAQAGGGAGVQQQ